MRRMHPVPIAGFLLKQQPHPYYTRILAVFPLDLIVDIGAPKSLICVTQPK